MEIANLVISHKKATVEEIQNAWHGDYRALIERILSHDGIRECAVLLTCNRVEVYVVGENCSDFLHSFAEKMGVSDRIIEIHQDRECLEHLLRVASGLESMMVGEDQILGQVRDLYCLAKEMGGIGDVLDLVFRKAIHVGKKVRTLTGISRGAISIGSAAVQLAEKTLGSLRGKKVLIVGAGEMGGLVARAISHKNANAIFIANRTFDNARKLAEDIGGIAVNFSEMGKYMVTCDVVISATSAPHCVITEDTVRRVMQIRNDHLYIIDIAMPRDVEEGVGYIDGVTVYTIDNLREISRRNLEARLKEAKKAEDIIKKELAHLIELLKEKEVDELISDIYLRADRLKNEEIVELYNKLKSKYDVGEEILPTIEAFADSLIRKLLHPAVMKLRYAARNDSKDLIKVAEHLFSGGDYSVSKKKNEEIEER